MEWGEIFQALKQLFRDILKALLQFSSSECQGYYRTVALHVSTLILQMGVFIALVTSLFQQCI